MAGRPRIQVDVTKVQQLASIHCTTPEIAAIVGCSVDVLERRYAGVMETGRLTGKASLRRLQWKGATQGSVAMQIWLGKQLLNQRDKQEVTGDATRPIGILEMATLKTLPSEKLAELLKLLQQAQTTAP